MRRADFVTSRNCIEQGSRTRFGNSRPSKSVLRPSAFLLCAAFPFVAPLLQAQSVASTELLLPASELSSYVRVLELDGKAKKAPLGYWSSSTEPRRGGLSVDSGHVWSGRYSLSAVDRHTQRAAFRILDTRAELLFNSAFPRTANDGAVWMGRGLTAVVRGGAEMQWRGFTARLAPTFAYSQNRTFPLGAGPGNDSSEFAYPWQADIDFPQRFGTDPVTLADWGQSAIRFDARSFTVGFSTENLWWGPAYRNAIVMGSSAPGFPHFDIGLAKPVHTIAGELEVRAIWGQLTRSKYSGSGTTNGRRMLSGLTIGYQPKFISGLTLGLNRALYKEWPNDGVGASDLLDAFGGFFNKGERLEPGGPQVNNLNDQLTSVTARWLLPESGAEFYVEFARNDFAGSITDLALEPDHSRAFTAGFQKTLSVKSGAFVLKGEHTTLGQPATKQLREGAPFYVHGIVTEGYTHRGQLLGAAIGPGSNAQYIGLDRYTSKGRYGMFAERIRYDDDYAFGVLSQREEGFLQHQTDLTIGASMLRFAGVLDWSAGLAMTRQLNRYFVRYNNLTNWALSFSVTRRGRNLRGMSAE